MGAEMIFTVYVYEARKGWATPNKYEKFTSGHEM